jgi:hypothetical protein
MALVMGLKHYLGPFDVYGKEEVPFTPFDEEQRHQPVDNFYYAQEDEVFAAAEKYHSSWSVHRPHTIIGYAAGNAMNMGRTLAVYATLYKQTGQPIVFPGSSAKWQKIATQFSLKQVDVNKLASWRHTNADLGRPMEVFTDISKSRKAGFMDYQYTRDSFIELLDKLKAGKMIP